VKKVFQTFVVSKDMSHIPNKIMSLGTQSMKYSGQLKIMSGIMLFMGV
jgi:hypothetical protein